jgi:hypothetical protein
MYLASEGSRPVADTIPLRPASDAAPARGLTLAEVAARYRVGQDKVRGWVRRGELRAVNTATTLSFKPRWVISLDALAEFERRRAGGPAPKPQRQRRRSTLVDYYPD